MIASSEVLEKSAERVRNSGRPTLVATDVGKELSAAQCETMARLLKEAEPSVITGGHNLPPGTVVNQPQERPGFLEKAQQDPDDPEHVVFQVGMLPATLYRIDREGKEEEL